MDMQMNTTDAALPRTRTAKGRKDNAGQDAVIKMAPVRERTDEAIMLYKASVDAGEQFAEAIKAIAEKSGLLAGVVRKYVVAKAGEKFDEEKRKVEQLSLVFDEAGK